MGKRTSHAPGTFSWVDLATTDAAAAKAFYAELFGWELQDVDAGDGATYTMCRLGGDAVAGIFAMTGEMHASGVPPNWTSYVTVADADAAVARARELGGEAIDEAFDIGDVGRMAVLRDPQGAVFAVWQPKTRIGAERVNDVGCLVMNELVTTDLDGARAFYEALFGWEIAPFEGPPAAPDAFVQNDGRINAAAFRAPGGVPSHWRACFTVASTAGALERIRALGGADLGEPAEIGDGSHAVARDPQGAVFTLFTGETDD
jgi:predicted enzyme related to lactoylglutathione lyase